MKSLWYYYSSKNVIWYSRYTRENFLLSDRDYIYFISYLVQLCSLTNIVEPTHGLLIKIAYSISCLVSNYVRINIYFISCRVELNSWGLNMVEPIYGWIWCPHMWEVSSAVELHLLLVKRSSWMEGGNKKEWSQIKDSKIFQSKWSKLCWYA